MRAYLLEQPNRPYGADDLRRLGVLHWRLPLSGSEREIERIKHDLIDIARMRIPGSEDIRFTTGDSQRNRVIIGVQRLTDEVAAAIVARYGTEVVAVLVDPRYGPFSLRD